MEPQNIPKPQPLRLVGEVTMHRLFMEVDWARGNDLSVYMNWPVFVNQEQRENWRKQQER